MPAYVICDVQVTDAAAYDEYRRLSSAAGERFGVRFLARGGAAELLEGDGEPERIVIMEFADLATARAWYDSEEYRAARAARAGAARTRFLLVEGVEATP